MTKLISIFLTIMLLKYCDGSKKTLPVLMMDHDAVMSRMTLQTNPFKKISSDFFTELALNAISRSECVILFIEDTLSTEDISLKDDLNTPFYNLQKGIIDKKAIYIPSVAAPYELLQQIFEPHVSNTFHLDSVENLKIRDHKYVYVFFQDEFALSRADKLRKHDTLMREIYFTVRKLKAAPVLAFYTGKRNPVTIEPFTFELAEPIWEPPHERGVTVVSSEALFRFTGMYSTTKTRRSSFEDTPVIEYEMRTRKSMSTTMLVTDFHLEFNFEFEEEAWKLTNVVMLDRGDEVGRIDTDISAPWQRSYFCSEPISIVNRRDGSSITIPEYQIEPLVYRREGFQDEPEFDPDAEKVVPILRQGPTAGTTATPTAATTTDIPGHCYFSKAFNCGPYFNTHILSGLFVFAIFMAIVFWGVIMIMNCGRNDRMEDPNEKHLNVAEVFGDRIEYW